MITTPPLLVGKQKYYTDDLFYVEPSVHVRGRTTRCCSGKLVCSLVCTALLFGFAISSQEDVSFLWETTDMDWKSQNSTFSLYNHNFLKSYSNPADKIHQMFWYCKDIESVTPDCDWITTQTLAVPEYKVDKEIWGGRGVHIRTSNKDWDKHVEHWSDMIDACKYGLLMVFWSFGSLRTPTYNVC